MKKHNKNTTTKINKAVNAISKNKKQATIFCVALFLILIVAMIGVGFYYLYIKPANSGLTGELSIHFLELGNNNTGDSIFIKSGNTDILVDAGSRTNSSKTISDYVDKYVEDNKLEYVIATHADQDHIAGFAGDGSNQSILEKYEVDTIIDFPKTNKTTQVYSKYVNVRDKKVAAGTKHYTALECYNETSGAKQSYEISQNVTLTILYNYYYENTTADENNYSVCFMIENGKDKYLFTGDLESSGEQKLIENNNLGKVKLFKAGHHGSKTSSTNSLLDIIQPEICVVTCVAGSVEYTQNFLNTFPTQDFINRISKHTQKVYVTTLGDVVENGTNSDGSVKYKDNGFKSLNGNIVIISNKGNITVNCSDNNTLLKDSEWFRANRQMPEKWLAA